VKRSRYSYFFESGPQFVGYSWLADDYVAFSLEDKENVKQVLQEPEGVVTNGDARIFEKLLKKRIIIPEKVNEFLHIREQHKLAILDTNRLRLIILPTFACNLDCPYCYETGKANKMAPSVINNIKSYLENRAPDLKRIRLSWFGGEPLLYPEIIREIGRFASDLAAENQVEFVSDVTTNGTLLTEDGALNELSRAGVRKAHVTIDGGKNTHDRKRVPVDGSGTYEQITGNSKRFLDADSENELTLRVHVHSGERREIQGIKRILSEFEGYRNRLKVYFRRVFSSCLDGPDQDLPGDEGKSSVSAGGQSKLEIAMEELYREAVDRGFELNFSRRSLASCYAAYNSTWVVKPDGFLHKCTLALEKERPLGELTEAGINLFWDSYLHWKERSTRQFIEDEISNCSEFPLSWGRCPYANFRNPDKSTESQELKNSIRTREKVLALKSRYRRRGDAD